MVRSNQFESKIVVITGSTAGIGLETAKLFASRGATVIVSSRKPKAVEETTRAIGCDGVVCNVSTKADREKLVDFVKSKYGRVDVFISNVAASLSLGDDCTEKQWEKMFDTNVKSAWLLAKDLVPLMPRGTGSIVFVSSYAGYNPSGPIGVYGVTKTALLGLTRMLANELGPSKGIRVNCVAPGVIRTQFSAPLWEAGESLGLLGRIGEPREIAEPIAFLASPEASFITGETVAITGGAHCRL
jgi:dehydrogenase/reductase SDR family member 4